MLNKNSERELAYAVYVDAIEPIEGKDRVECARVGGWTCMVPKGSMKPGEPAIYFEIDSKLPEVEPFKFLEKRHYKIKTQKFKAGEGHFFSQGLLMAASDFGWNIELTPYEKGIGSVNCIVDNEGNKYIPETDSAFLTKKLGVTYADAEDNKRKGKGVDKYKVMAGRHPKLFQNAIIKFLYKKPWGKRILFFFLGKKSDKKKEWPAWVVKTDEERVQNLTHMLEEYSKEQWYFTEKIDGTSTTFTIKKNKKKFEFFVCSRNVVMNLPNKKKNCYYEATDGNVYLEMAEKYHMEDVLTSLINEDFAGAEFITVQGETYGGTIQKRKYGNEHDLAVFNVIIGNKDGTTTRLNPEDGKAIMAKYGVPYVPVLGLGDIPATCEEILALAGGASKIDGLPREGLVFRTIDGKKSFKAVDNEFLAKYHG